MVTITLIAVVVVTIKVILFYQEVISHERESVNSKHRDLIDYPSLIKVDESITTFIPLEQKKGSKIKYTGHGFIPCDGYI